MRKDHIVHEQRCIAVQQYKANQTLAAERDGERTKTLTQRMKERSCDDQEDRSRNRRTKVKEHDDGRPESRVSIGCEV